MLVRRVCLALALAAALLASGCCGHRFLCRRSCHPGCTECCAPCEACCPGGGCGCP
jgi:hypothetical protein